VDYLDKKRGTRLFEPFNNTSFGTGGKLFFGNNQQFGGIGVFVK